MDLNELLFRQQVALMRATGLGSAPVDAEPLGAINSSLRSLRAKLGVSPYCTPASLSPSACT